MTTPQRDASLLGSIEDLFTIIRRRIEQSQYAVAVTTCDQILSIAPGDEDALRCKIVALVMDNKFFQGLLFLQSLENLPFDFGFLKAYCLYKLNKFDEALASLISQEQNEATLVLESQILYRIGKADACVAVYRKLQKSKVDLLEVNIVAGLVSAGAASEVKGMMETLLVKPTSSYELAFNVACSLIEESELADAEQLLLAARRIGQEVLMEEEDWDDDRIEKELAPLTVQLAYVQQLLGRHQEALESNTKFIGRDFDDELSVAVAVNNLITLKGLTAISDSMRRSGRLFDKPSESRGYQLTPVLELKLSARQKEVVFSNRVILLLHANRVDQARELVRVMQDMFPDTLITALLHAAVLVRENKPRTAEEILLKFAGKFPGKSRDVLLARAQIAAASGEPKTAAESLLSIVEIRHMPATISTIVSLKEQTGDVDGAAGVLSSEMDQCPDPAPLLREAAAFMLKHGKKEEAAAVYHRLFECDGGMGSLASLVAAAAEVDLEKAEAYRKRLKPLAGVDRIDVDSLEKVVGHAATDGYGEGKPNERSKKKKRKRKPRYPKGFDPSNPGPPPDPERWLPKKERSTYRPRRKDKRAAHMRGSQGAVARENEGVSSNSWSSRPNQTAQVKGRKKAAR